MDSSAALSLKEVSKRRLILGGVAPASQVNDLVRQAVVRIFVSEGPDSMVEVNTKIPVK